MRIFTIILLSLLVSNCSSTKKASNNNSMNINFEQLIMETQGGYSTAKFLVIKERETTLKIYNKINSIRKPGFKIPNINYEKQMLLALFMGEKSSGGYTISVDHILETSAKVTVFVKEQTPEGMATMALTSPFCFVLVDKNDKDIIFEKVN